MSLIFFFQTCPYFCSSSSKLEFCPVPYFSKLSIFFAPPPQNKDFVLFHTFLFFPSFCSSSSKLGFCPVPYFCKLVLIFCSSSSKLGWILSVWCGVGQLCLWGTFAESHRNQQHKKVFKTSHRRIGIKTDTK